MSDSDKELSLPGFADVERDPHGLERIAVTAGAARAQIYLHGAHVTHFHPAGQDPVLFKSAQSLFQPGKAIRGGVPIVFPWFGPNSADPKLPAHGFARTLPWKLESLARDGDRAIVELSLTDSPLTRQVWPHSFELRYRVAVGANLKLELTTRNTGAAPFTFEEALHTYLAVADVRQVTIEGLCGRDYLDKVQGGKHVTQGDAPIAITGETDRVYLATRDAVTVNDPAGRRRLVVSKQSSDATVVWNPWVARAKALSDFGDDEWPKMLCVETANLGESAVKLAPGQSHTMRAAVGLA